MFKICKNLEKLINKNINLNTIRLINTNKSSFKHAYEGDGKTKVQIMNNELDVGLLINSFSQYGFRLNNNIQVVGPMAIFPKSVLAWNVSDLKDINEDSLTLFYVLEPKIDILVLGIGDEHPTPQFSQNILKFMRKYKINVEVLRTEQACSTFNFLNAEHRVVAAALIPPIKISINENDVVQSQAQQQKLFTMERMM